MSKRRGRGEEERRRTRSRRDRSESAENQPHHFQFPPGGFIMYPLDPNHPYMGYPFTGPASSRQQSSRGRAPTQQQSSRGRAPTQPQDSRGRAPTQPQDSRGRVPTQPQSSRGRREQEEGEEEEEEEGEEGEEEEEEEGEEEEEVYDDNWAREQGYQMSPSAEPEPAFARPQAAFARPQAAFARPQAASTRSQAQAPDPPAIGRRSTRSLAMAAPEFIPLPSRKRRVVAAPVQAPPSPDILPNPLNDPETARLNERLKAIRRQERELERLCEPAASAGAERAAGGACSKGEVEAEWTQNRKEIEDLAKTIQSAWTNAITSGSINEAPITSLVDQYREDVGAERAMREGRRQAEQEAAENAAQRAAAIRGAIAQAQRFGITHLQAIFRDISTIGADILMSMILLAVLSTSESQDAIVQRILGTGTLATLYGLISTFVVRPFVAHNLDTIRQLPTLVEQGCTTSTLQQMHALLGLFITGATAYGVTHLGARTTPARAAGILSNIPPIQAFLASSRAAITGACSGSMNLVRTFIQDIRTNLLGRNAQAATSSSSSMASTSTYGSATSQEIGSVVVSIFGNEESMAPIIRQAFQELVQPPGQQTDTQVSALTQSQPFFEEEEEEEEEKKDGGRKRRTKSKQKLPKKKTQKRRH